MKTNAAGIWLLALFLAGIAGGNAWTEEAMTPPAPEEGVEEVVEEGEDLEYTFGTVKSVGATQVLITEFDYDTGEEKEAAYDLDPKVELNNVASLQEISPGDEVDIDYRVEGDKKIAQVISVAKPLPVAGPEGSS